MRRNENFYLITMELFDGRTKERILGSWQGPHYRFMRTISSLFIAFHRLANYSFKTVKLFNVIELSPSMSTQQHLIYSYQMLIKSGFTE